jgi:UDP:flavonoid glycosyltransferase YjiC (YdhE family)
MRITIHALGTRGDVEPALALAGGLVRAGHAVRILAGSNFRAAVERSGMEFAPSIDMETVMKSEKGAAWSQSSANPMRQLRLMRELLDEYGDDMTRSIVDASQGADLMVSSFVTAPFVQAVSEAFRQPHIPVLLQPYHPTRSGPASLMPIRPRRTSILNRWAGLLTLRFMWGVASDAANRLRQRLNLPPGSAREYIRTVLRTPTLLALSPVVVPHAPDWGPHVVQTGYLFRESGEGWQPPDSLARFLQAGPPPVYVGFGSMTEDQPGESVALVRAALSASGQRGIVASGWAELNHDGQPDPNILFVQSAPHDWLFPRLAGIVHHGGAGTTAASLRAGVPALLVPHMSDQPYWARRVQALGAGPKPIPRHRLTAHNLADGIRALVTDTAMQARARALGEAIRAEDGVRAAVESIERLHGV